MDVTGANNKTLHRPRAEDPFAKPPEYKQSYTQLEGEISGLTDAADRRQAARRSIRRHRAVSARQRPGNGSGASAATTSRPIRRCPRCTNDPKKPTPHLAITTADATAYRGDVIHVEGPADASGKPLPDHRIDVFVAPVGQHGQHATKLGTAFTTADGPFSADLAVPASLALQTYELYLSSPEDAYYNAALTTESPAASRASPRRSPGSACGRARRAHSSSPCSSR